MHDVQQHDEVDPLGASQPAVRADDLSLRFLREHRELFNGYLDDRFHETSIGEANRRGTERMLVDSSFEELNEERHHGNMAASA